MGYNDDQACLLTTDAYPHRAYCLRCYCIIIPNIEWIEHYNLHINYCPNCGRALHKIKELK